MSKPYFSSLASFVLFLFGYTVVVPARAQHSKDPYLTDLYDSLHISPLQEKFDMLHPMPVGVVYVQHPGDGEKEMQQQFRLMKKLGFNCLKQIETCPGWTEEQVALIALQEGLIPWSYGEGGWAPVTPKLLRQLNIPVNTSMAKIRKNPRMLKYQKEVMKKRIERTQQLFTTHPDIDKWGASVAFDPKVGGKGLNLTDEGKKLFSTWVKKKYGNINRLNQAWNQQHFGLQGRNNDSAFRSWADFNRHWQNIGKHEYRHLMDILQFKVENSLENAKIRAEKFQDFDSCAAFRGGGELSLFLPEAWWGVDIERIANLMANYGSFYPSMHFAWHFGEVNYELVRPIYMQAALAVDFMKGGWVGGWESTGGPQQFSGGKGGAGFTVDAAMMTQFILSRIAAGFKGFGLWCWDSRSAGWEAGEYALLDRNRQVTPRAITVGKIAQAMQKYRDELWKAHKQPLVGILTDWNNEALWAAMSISGRDNFKDFPVDARIGVSRTLINGNIPFEYVTKSDIKAGLAMRYKVIYLSAELSFPDTLMNELTDYVKKGGRLVMDLPSAWFDKNGALLPTNKGSDFEQLFGVTLNDFQYAGVNRDYRIDSLSLNGFTANITPVSAQVLTKYDTGLPNLPAITDNKFDKGHAILLGYEASKMCVDPGNKRAEKMLLKYTMGNYVSPYSCDGAIVYHLAAPKADHYFIINDGPEKTVNLKINFNYSAAQDAITGEKLPAGMHNIRIQLPAHSGRWIRTENEK